MEQHNQQLTKQERYELRHQEKIKEQAVRRQKRLYRRIVLWSVAVLAIAGAIFGIVQLVKTPADNGAPVSVAAIAENDWVKGNREAAVLLIKYSDFQCGACASYYLLVKQLADEFGDDVAFVYRHFPLGIFPHSRAAAQAAEAAGKQGKFWEMHDMIFDNQRIWSSQRSGKAEEKSFSFIPYAYANHWMRSGGQPAQRNDRAKDSFISYAESLALDIEQFKRDIDSREAMDRINRDH